MCLVSVHIIFLQSLGLAKAMMEQEIPPPYPPPGYAQHSAGPTRQGYHPHQQIVSEKAAHNHAPIDVELLQEAGHDPSTGPGSVPEPDHKDEHELDQDLSWIPKEPPPPYRGGKLTVNIPLEMRPNANTEW